MATKNREAIFVALHSILEARFGSTMLVTRRYYSIDAVPQLPILMVLEGDETVSYDDVRSPGTWSLAAELRYIDRESGDSLDAPAAPLHDFIDAIDDVVSPSAGHQTLNGTAIWCRIDGTVMKSPPDSSEPLSIAVVPLEIRAVG